MKKKIILITAGILCVVGVVTAGAVKVVHEIREERREIAQEREEIKQDVREEVREELKAESGQKNDAADKEIMPENEINSENGQIATPVPDNGATNLPPSEKPQNTPAAGQNTQNFIGEAKAKEIALNKAGLTESEVRFDRVELDRDDGVYRYEVEFQKGYTEYEADISAIDGSILEWKVDTDD